MSQPVSSDMRENFATFYAGLLDVFARTNIINQIGVLVSVFPGIP